MSVNGIGTSNASLNTYNVTATNKQAEQPTVKGNPATEEAGATYERSKGEGVTLKAKNPDLVNKMKLDVQSRIDSMQSLVEKMFSKQGITIAKADDMWKQLANGEFEADPETIAQAKEDISEDGYWGVKKTSERIFDFAMALSGGDEKKMEEMRKAVEKGFGQATKAWGKELPSISNDTYDAVMKKFDDYKTQG